MSEGFLLLLVLVSGVCYLVGRWDGIRKFDNEMVKAGLLPPRPDRDEDKQ